MNLSHPKLSLRQTKMTFDVKYDPPLTKVDWLLFKSISLRQLF